MTGSGLTGRLSAAASGHLSYEVEAANSDLLEEIADVLARDFGFAPAGERIVALDDVLHHFSRLDVTLALCWDIWSGAYVLAHSDAGDVIVRAFAARFEEVLASPEFAKYVQAPW